MKRLVCINPGHFEYQDLEKPSLQPGHALLKIRRIGICGTDLHAFEGTQPFFKYPRVLGHELAASYEAGDAPGFTAGEIITFIPYFNCGHCIACRTGKPNCCAAINVFGVHIDGGMSEYVTVPSQSLIHGGGLSMDELALVEPLAIGAHGLFRANVQPGEFVAVIGAGPIGLGTMELAGKTGAQVIAIDLNEERLSFCRAAIGVKHTINPVKEDVMVKLKEITNGDMPTVVIDASGSQKAINTGFSYLAHGGRYVLIGLQGKEISFSHPEFHKREATLMSSRNATRKDFEMVIDLMSKGLINPANYITHRVRFDEVKDNFASWLDPSNKVIKAMVSLDSD